MRRYAAAAGRASQALLRAAASTNSQDAPRFYLPAGILAGLVMGGGIAACDQSDEKVYKLAEVARHKGGADGVWVYTDDGGVYDVTSFVANHPGGNKILLAAGASLEPYWRVYQQHKKPEVAEILQQFRIGRLDPADLAAAQAAAAAAAAAAGGSADPYARDPPRHPALIPRSTKPYNAEPPAQLLDSYITPTELLFVRNHLPVPHIDPATYKLRIEADLPGDDSSATGTGAGLRRVKLVELSLADLQSRYPHHTVTAALQCAGNRRADMNAAKTARGLAWNVAAIGNVTWTGVRVRDVLLDAGIVERDVPRLFKHLHAEGLDRDPASDTVYGASVPVDAILCDPRSEALLAWEMNGQPLGPDHGAPLRLVVPGVVGARQVKWCGKLVLSPNESGSLWQQKDYKAFPPTQDLHNVQYDSMPAMQDMPVNSAIVEPVEGGVCADAAVTGTVTVKGWAWSGGGRAITRVEVTPDGGATWIPAQLVAQPDDPSPSHTRSYGWTLWQATVPLPAAAASGSSGSGAPRTITLACKASDVACNTQPESALPIWNFRGLANNSWHKVQVTVPAAEQMA